MAHLSGFGLENFRVFKDYTWFDFAPITLFVGPNSSGKSSVIKALLLLEDNFRKKLIPHGGYEWLMGYEGLIDFSGKNHNLQNERSIIPHDAEGKEVKFSLPYEGFGGLNPLRQPLFWETSYQIKEQGLMPGITTKLRTDTKDLFVSDIGNGFIFFDALLLKNILRNEGEEAAKSVTDRDRNISNYGNFEISLIDKLLWPTVDELKQTLEVIDLGIVQRILDDALWPDNSDVLKILLDKLSTEKSYKIAKLINNILKVDSLHPAFNSWSGFVYVPSIKGLPKRYLRFDDDSG